MKVQSTSGALKGDQLVTMQYEFIQFWLQFHTNTFGNEFSIENERAEIIQASITSLC